MGLIFIIDTFLKLLSAVCIIKIFLVVQITWFSFCKSSVRTLCERFHKHAIYLMKQKYENQLNACNTLDLVKNTLPIPRLPIPPGLT